MIGNTVVKSTVFTTQAGTSILNPKGVSHKKSIFSDLLLTALIDAFSILVIFLLISFSANGEVIYMNKKMELPKAVNGEHLERNTVVKIEEDKIFVEDKEVAKENLVAALMDVRTKFKETRPNEEFPGILTIQADRRAKYSDINNIVLATGNAGFSDIKFAVIMR
jgi:biopolymer transport protein ExbD